MNAFKELVTPRNSSVPVHKSVQHHSRLPAGRRVEGMVGGIHNERSKRNSLVRTSI